MDADVPKVHVAGDHRHLADLGRRAQRGGHSVQTKGDVYVSESRLALAAD